MLYDEFIEGTKCKDNEHNYKVYKNLEIMYMNSNMSKAEIYEYGKKLVDNSKSEKMTAFENEIKNKIEEHKKYIQQYKNNIEWENGCYEPNKNVIKYYKDAIKYSRQEIKKLKFILENA